MKRSASPRKKDGFMETCIAKYIMYSTLKKLKPFKIISAENHQRSS